MYRYIYAFLLSICLFFLPCCTMKKTSKPQFNAYMPPSFDDFFEEEVLPIEHITDSSTNNWDTANIGDISYTEGDEIAVGIFVKCQGSGSGAWGKIDAASLSLKL